MDTLLPAAPAPPGTRRAKASMPLPSPSPAAPPPARTDGAGGNFGAALQRAREQERQRLARDLHDDLGQLLAAMHIELDLLALRVTACHEAQARVDSLQALLGQVTGALRRAIAGQAPRAVAEGGLVAALSMHAEALRTRHGFELALELPDCDPPLGRRRQAALYRLAQEALSNAARHAHASHVELRLCCQGGALQLTIRDDGSGLPLRARRGAFGLAGMRQRAAELGARLYVGRAQPSGTEVRLTLPLAGA